MNRIVIFGDRPGEKSDPLDPLYPYDSRSAGAKLADLMSLSYADYSRWTDRYNVWHDGEKTLRREAAKRRFLELLKPRTDPTDTVFWFLVVGKKAAEIVGSQYPIGQYDRVIPNIGITVIPHTSGRCREWNDPEFTERMKQRLSSWANSHIP